MGTSAAARQFVVWASLATAIIVLLPTFAAAQEPVKSFDQLDTRLKAGDTVWVTDAQGREIKGKIRELTPSALVLDNGNGRTFEAGDVARINQRQGSKVRKGALWGVIVGGALSVGSLAYGAQGCTGEACGLAVLAVPILIGAGAGIGALVGKGMPGKELVVYRAPATGTTTRIFFAPVITPRRTGVVVSFAF